jgi:hypothetical protein
MQYLMFIICCASLFVILFLYRENSNGFPIKFFKQKNIGGGEIKKIDAIDVDKLKALSVLRLSVYQF